MRTGGLQSDRPQFVSRAVEIVKAAAAEIRRITETYDGVLTRDGAQLAGRGYAGAPVAPGDRFSPDAARRDAERLRAALADPDAKDVLLDDATTTLQALDAQVRAGHPLTAEQQRYITDFANIAGTDALVALPGLADTGVQQGADRAEAAVAGTLSALTNPELGGTADVAALPAVLRTLTDDPLSAVDDPGRRTDLVHQLEALPRYEGVNQLLGATSVPLGDQFSVTAGQQAIKTSQLTAQVLDRQHFPMPLGLQHRRLPPRAGGGGARLLAAAVQRVPQPGRGADAAAGRRHPQGVAGHPARRRDRGRGTARPGDGPGRPVDGTGPAAEAAAATDAKENAQIAAAVLTDVAQDPYGWREAIGKGTPVSDAITGIVVDNIDAFGRDSDAAVDVFTPARIEQGQYGGFSLGRQDAQDVLTFVGAGRPEDGPDADLVRVHVAAGQFTQHQIQQAALGAQDPGTAFGAAGSVTAAVNTADFRSAMHQYDDADAARKSLFENGSLAAGVVVDKAVELATAPLPGLVGDGVSALVDHAIDGFAPDDTAGQKGTDLVTAIYGRQSLEADHLVVSSLEQAGRLPADTPDLAAVTDASGRGVVAGVVPRRQPGPGRDGAGPHADRGTGEDRARRAPRRRSGLGGIRPGLRGIDQDRAGAAGSRLRQCRSAGRAGVRRGGPAPGEGSCAVGLHVNRGPAAVAMLMLAVVATLTGCTNAAQPGASPSTPVDTEVPFAAPAGISDTDYDVDTFDTCSPFRSTLWLKAAVVDRQLGPQAAPEPGAAAGGAVRGSPRPSPSSPAAASGTCSTDPRYRPGERGWDGNSYWQTATSDETRVCHSFLAAGPARPETVIHVTVETEEVEAPLHGGGDAHACVFASTLVGASALILEPAPTTSR